MPEKGVIGLTNEASNRCRKQTRKVVRRMLEDNVKQDTENLEDSQSEKKSAEDTDVNDVKTDSSKSDDQKTSEEITWESLKGSTQDRIKELIRERDDYR